MKTNSEDYVTVTTCGNNYKQKDIGIYYTQKHLFLNLKPTISPTKNVLLCIYYHYLFANYLYLPFHLWNYGLSLYLYALLLFFLLFSKKEEATLGDTQTTEAATTEEKTNEEPTQVETEDKQVEEQTEGKTITAKQESVHSWKTTLLVPKRSILTRIRLVPGILGLGSMGNACYSKIKLSSMG